MPRESMGSSTTAAYPSGGTLDAWLTANALPAYARYVCKRHSYRSGGKLCSKTKVVALATATASNVNGNVEEKTITTTTVAFPEVYFSEEKTEDENVSTLESTGCTDVTKNEDGGYAVTTPTDKYNELVDSTHNSATITLDGWTGSKYYPKATLVKHDDQFAHVPIILNTTTIGLQDMLDSYAAWPVSCHAVVKISAGDVSSDKTYPDDWKGAGPETSEAPSAP